MKNNILLFLKGVLMGICDLIPGISGGTIAFITGIYIKLINSIKSISPKFFYDLLKAITNRGKTDLEELKKDIKKIDIPFLFVLLLGIATSLLLGSRIIKFLLDNYFSYTLAFFVGLILASSKIIFNNIKNHNLKNITFSLLGLAVGFLFSILVPLSPTPKLFYVFIGGFFAISAMFLPGISGAFILLILGLYEFMVNILHNIPKNINYILAFIFGALLGAFIISRIISFLFKKDKCKTLYFLLGLVLGSLSLPIKKIFQNTMQVFDISIILFFIIIGTLLVIIIEGLGKKRVA